MTAPYQQQQPQVSMQQAQQPQLAMHQQPYAYNPGVTSPQHELPPNYSPHAPQAVQQQPVLSPQHMQMVQQPQQQQPQQQHQQQQQQQPVMQHQPVVRQGMAYAVQPPPATQDWKQSLVDCSPCGTCCLAYWCPCIVLGKNQTRMRDPTMQSYETCNPDCMIMTAINCLTGCGFVYAAIKRNEMRRAYGIKGNGCGDCCAMFWCSCCALTQEHQETVIRAEAALRQGYQPMAQMQMQPQMQPQQQQQQQQSQQPQQQPQNSK